MLAEGKEPNWMIDGRQRAHERIADSCSVRNLALDVSLGRDPNHDGPKSHNPLHS